ncbi:Putative Zn-dependent protease, contains TPR repeats [Solimonas aquatica]|uniref:Putative beta-barrel assembly-enhancing protease n=1 Tax=Solimonas aquatica TaxID=489703 RepID=A0A1H8ZWZ2_9GAMM|nr:M48 family metalloprotease [Solimonas aquatica]SEP68972.1 Putative Zn-dependent protease, contains TPR repeats [Solimonas aquatica]
MNALLTFRKCFGAASAAVLLLLSAAVAAATGSAALDLPQIGEPADNMLSPLQEKDLGKRVMAELYRDGYALEDPELSDYLNNIGYQLAAASATQPPQLTFFVVQDPRINAFALPGGFIGVNAGLLLVADNESELAGVMGHELAHVTQRHIARAAEDTQVGTIATWLAVIAAIIAGSSNPDVVMGALAIGQSINYQRQVSYTRSHEQEADRIGIQTMAAAGFDPNGMASFFGKLQQQTRLYGNRLPEILLTHPLSTNRIAEAAARASEMPAHKHLDSIEFSLMRSRARVFSAEVPGETLDYFAGQVSGGRDTPENRYGLALAQQEHNDYSKAADTLQPLLSRYPRQANIQLLNAELLAQTGKRDQSLQAYEAVLKQFPRYAPAILAYAEALMNAGHPETARQYLISHDQGQGTQMLTYRLLAQAARESNNIAESAYQMSTYFFLRGDAGSALAQLDAALRLPNLTPQDRSRLMAKRKEVRDSLPSNYRPV